MTEETFWSLPYASRREPICAENIVATSQPLAAQAGLQMIMRGGTAVDAAIASAAALTVTEPTSNGLGSDAFAIVYKDGTLHGVNGSGRSPKLLTSALLEAGGRFPELGWLPVTVPGAIAAWHDLHERFGRLPFGDLLEPAMRFARDGFPVAPQTARAWARAAETFRDFGPWRETFLVGGRAPHAGERVRLPHHAATLAAIAEDGGASFYRGTLAAQVDAHARATGGLMRAEDLAEHQSEWVTPLAMSAGDHILHELPPNGQGIAALLALGIFRMAGGFQLDPADARCVHLQIEAMKIAFAEAHRTVADPDFLEVDPASLIAPEALDRFAARIDRSKALDPGHGRLLPGGTVLLCAADAEGTMVSFIQSNYMGFGSGIVIPETGIALQNRGACFSLEPGHPNEAAGGKRPYHTILPGFITRMHGDGTESPFMAFGVMGGFMQPQGHLQMMLRTAWMNENPQAALDAPRWQVAPGLGVLLEEDFPANIAERLRQLGHRVTTGASRSVAFGGGQAVMRWPSGGHVAGSDARRDGQAVGW